jgi:O-antigen/teichoic acid export membrane protein
MTSLTGPTTSTRVIRNTGVLLAGRVAGTILGAASTVLFARSLGSEKLGQFSALYAYVSLFTWLASLGIEPVLTREASRKRGEAGSIVATGIALCGLVSLATSILVVIFAGLAGFVGEQRVLVAFVTVEILIFGPLRLPGIVFQVDLRQSYGVTINLGRQVAWLLVITVLAHFHASLLTFILARLAVAAGELISILFVAAKLLPGPHHILWDQLKPLLQAGAPIAISAILASVYLRIDQVLLHKLASDQALGGYAAAVKITELFEMFPAAFLSSLFPLMAVSGFDSARMTFLVDRIFRYIMVPVGGLCVFMALGSDLIVRIVFGADFTSSGRLLRILIWSEYSVFFGAIVVHVLLAKNLQKFLVYPTVIGAAANVLLNLILIPRYGASGSAWATVVSYTAAWMMVLLSFRATRGLIWEGLRCAIPLSLLSLISAFSASLIPAPTIVRLGLGVLAYSIGVWGSRVITRQDIVYCIGAVRQSLRGWTRIDASLKPE